MVEEMPRYDWFDKAGVLVGVIAFLLLISGAVSLNCADSPLAWYTLDNADVNSTSFFDVCATHNGTLHGGITGVPAVFGEGMNTTSTSYPRVNDLMNITGDGTITAWVWLDSSTSTYGQSVAVQYGTAAGHSEAYDLSLRISTSGYLMASLGDGVSTGESITSNLFLEAKKWHFVAVRVNGSEVKFWANDSICTNTTTITPGGGGGHYGIGTHGDYGTYYNLVGTIDDVTLWDRALSDAEISDIMTYSYQKVGLVSPPNNTHDNSAPSWTYNSYGNMSSCSLYANNTYRATNTTDIVLNANNTLSWSPPSDGRYDWYVSCNASGTLLNSTTWVFTLDTQSPYVTINEPTTTSGTYWIGDTITQNGTYTDNIDLYNCTQDIYYPNGTLAATDFTNCSGTSYTYDTQSFTANTAGFWTANYSAMDSHTAHRWKPDFTGFRVGHGFFTGHHRGHVNAGEEPFVVKKDSVTYSFTPIGMTAKRLKSTNYFILPDRVKWGYEFNPIPSNFVGEVLFSSNKPISIRNSGIAGHMVTGEEWVDMVDLEKQGFSTALERVNDTAVIMKFWKPSYTMEERLHLTADPATGGLNFGSAEGTFLVNGFTLDVFDETNTSQPITNWKMVVSNSTYSRTFTDQNNTFTWNNISAFPTGAITMVLSASGYPARTYNENYGINTPLAKTAYLLSSSDGVYATFVVQDALNSPIAGASITFEILEGSTWTEVGSITTDETGSASAWLSFDTNYRITVSKTGYTTVVRQVVPTGTTYIIVLGSGSGFSYDEANNTLWTSLAPTQTTVHKDTTITMTAHNPTTNTTICGMNFTFQNGTLFQTGNSTTVTNDTCTYAMAPTGVGNETKFYAVPWFKDSANTTYYWNRLYTIWGGGGQLGSGIAELDTYFSPTAKLFLAVTLTLFAGAITAMYIGTGTILIMIAVSGILMYSGWFAGYEMLWFIAVTAGLAALYLERRRGG